MPGLSHALIHTLPIIVLGSGVLSASGYLAVALAATPGMPTRASSSEARRCSMLSGEVRAVVRVERDTVFPLVTSVPDAPSSFPPPAGPRHAMLAGPDTPMPTARVRVLRLDRASRAALAAAGVRDAEPLAFMQAQPYGADCRTIRHIDSVPWVRRGDVGFINATLAPRKLWVQRTPTFIVSAPWSYPYPQQSGLLRRYPVRARPPYASADAVFEFDTTLVAANGSRFSGGAQDRSARARVIAWATNQASEREFEPLRHSIREAILGPDWQTVKESTSRFRGSYVVRFETSDTAFEIHFRTLARPTYPWTELDSARSTAQLLASPFSSGYQLVAYAATSANSLLTLDPAGGSILRQPLAWLGLQDRPTAPATGRDDLMPAQLEFQIGAAPEAAWPILEPYVPDLRSVDSLIFAQSVMRLAPSDRQVRLPLTLMRRNRRWVGDTVLERAGRRLHVIVTRRDSTVVSRPY